MFVTMRHFDGHIVMGFGYLDAAVEDIDTTVRTMRGMLSDLETSLNAKTADWVGQARTDYNTAKTDWNNAADRIGTHLDDVKQAVLRSREEMWDREQASARRFTG